MPLRSRRRILAVLCVAIVAFAVVVPAAGGGDVLAFLMPVWLEFQPVFIVVSSLEATSSPEQPVSLRSLGASRAPPATLLA